MTSAIVSAEDDNDQVGVGEANAAEMAHEYVNVASDGVDSDDTFMQAISTNAAKKGDGLNAFGTTETFNKRDADKVDAGELTVPFLENPNEDANVYPDYDSDDNSHGHLAHKKVKVARYLFAQANAGVDSTPCCRAARLLSMHSNSPSLSPTKALLCRSRAVSIAAI